MGILGEAIMTFPGSDLTVWRSCAKLVDCDR